MTLTGSYLGVGGRRKHGRAEDGEDIIKSSDHNLRRSDKSELIRRIFIALPHALACSTYISGSVVGIIRIIRLKRDHLEEKMRSG